LAEGHELEISSLAPISNTARVPRVQIC